jgi:two-component system NarL family sensor kinase
VADVLHDEVLQDLLAAGQDVAEAVHRLGDDATLTRAAEAIDRSAAQLRGLLGEMQAAAPEAAGLPAALADVADRLSRQGGLAVDWSVAPDAEGPHDALVLSLARELLVNVAKHAHARHATATVSRRGETVVVRVTDDGRGYAQGRLEEAARQGHIGLTSALAKAHAVGGTVEVAGSPGHGTTALVRLPLP